MSTVALVLYAVALIVIFGVRSWLQRRRTGSAGFHGISGTPGEAGWWGGVLFIVAIVLGLAGPALNLAGVVVAVPPLGVQVLGLVLALATFVAPLAGQTGMGNECRIGVDPAERNDPGHDGAVRRRWKSGLQRDGRGPRRDGDVARVDRTRRTGTERERPAARCAAPAGT